MGGERYAVERSIRVGLCAGCAHAIAQRNARGSEFWRCRRADADASLRRYPALPVRTCAAFEPDAPEARRGQGSD